ncbi:hypothetical protein C7M84_004048 [Penaeus vannamei]|uniref:Uncharacterized protein n=1 Tax=Penaeus vannamei TaxID=6689 RepID=A0A3R7QT94_PENVA|nr:hypothetical protein C7M84_004048 [Penaeus vannamei]
MYWPRPITRILSPAPITRKLSPDPHHPHTKPPPHHPHTKPRPPSPHTLTLRWWPPSPPWQRGAHAFSFGRLFPASRSGIRGALIRGSGGQKTPSNILKERGEGGDEDDDGEDARSSRDQEAFSALLPAEAPGHGRPSETVSTRDQLSHLLHPPASESLRPVRPLPTKKPSPITWLAGPWFFNGRPSNMFIFNSPHNPGHFDKLHQTYSKPGVYTK